MNKVRVAVLGYGHLGKWHCDKAIFKVQINIITFVCQFVVEKTQQFQKTVAIRYRVAGIKVILRKIIVFLLIFRCFPSDLRTTSLHVSNLCIFIDWVEYFD